jgi:hypothetical protein
MSLEEIRIHAQRFQKRIRNRNIREYSATVIVIAWLGASIWLLKPVLVIRVALGLLVAGSLVIVYQLHKRASTRTLPANLALTSCMEFHRLELERQRDAQQNVWFWYILPAIPGLLVLIIALALIPNGRGLVPASILAALYASTFMFIVKLNQRAARRLQRKIDELRG